MKKTAIVLLVFLTSSVCFATLPDFPFVSVEGRAEVELAPETAEVTFRVEAFHKNADDALSTVNERSKQLLQFFAQSKIKKEDVLAYSIDKRAVREEKDYLKLDITGYEIKRRFSVTLHNLDNYEEFIKKLLSMENVVNIYTKFDRKDREKVETDLLAKASKDARRQAQRLAEGFGSRLGPVFAISETGFWDFDFEYGIDDFLYGGGETSEEDDYKFLFIPSTITFEKEVTAIFKLQSGQ